MKKRNIGQEILKGIREVKEWLLGEKHLVTREPEIKKAAMRMRDIPKTLGAYFLAEVNGEKAAQKFAFSLNGEFSFIADREYIEKRFGEGYVIETAILRIDTINGYQMTGAIGVIFNHVENLRGKGKVIDADRKEL